MKPSKIMIGLGAAAAVAVAVTVPVAANATGGVEAKAIGVVGGYTAGSVITTCTIGTPVAVGAKKVEIPFTVTAGSADVTGSISAAVDGSASVANYKGVTKTLSFGGLTTGTSHSVTLSYTPPSASSIYASCSKTSSFSF
jgi:hypothetical protein